jgi:hypothetical protein
MKRYVKSDRFIQLDATHITTNQVKLEKEQLLDLVRGGWDTCGPIGRPFAFDPAALTDEQRAALEHTLTSRDLVMDILKIGKPPWLLWTCDQQIRRIRAHLLLDK